MLTLQQFGEKYSIPMGTLYSLIFRMRNTHLSNKALQKKSNKWYVNDSWFLEKKQKQQRVNDTIASTYYKLKENGVSDVAISRYLVQKAGSTEDSWSVFMTYNITKQIPESILKIKQSKLKLCFYRYSKQLLKNLI